MTFPTVAVTVKLALLGGVTSFEGEPLTATLDRDERYGEFIVASQASAVVDVNGVAIIHCFPNHPTTGLGVTGSVYTFACRSISFRCTAQVPNRDCDLHSIADMALAPELSLAQIAEAQALASAAAALASQTAAAASATEADGDAVAAHADRLAADADASAAHADRLAADGAAAAANADRLAADVDAATARTYAYLALIGY